MRKPHSNKLQLSRRAVAKSWNEIMLVAHLGPRARSRDGPKRSLTFVERLDVIAPSP